MSAVVNPPVSVNQIPQPALPAAIYISAVYRFVPGSGEHTGFPWGNSPARTLVYGAAALRVSSLTLTGAGPARKLTIDAHGDPWPSPVTVARVVRPAASSAVGGLAGTVVEQVLTPSRAVLGLASAR